MDVKLTSPETFRVLRERAGLSQAQAARKLRIRSCTIISMIETGRRKPTAKLAGRIEKLFGIPAASWFSAESGAGVAEKVAA